MANPGIGFEFNALLLEQEIGFPVDSCLRQAVLGNSIAHHPAGFGQGVKNCDLITKLGQILRRSHSRRAGADNRHLLRPLLQRYDLRQIIAPAVIRRCPLQPGNRDRIIKFFPVALGFTGMVTNPAANTRERQASTDYFHGFFKFTLGNQRHITLGIAAGRTGLSARRRSPLFDHEFIRHRLRKQFIDCLPGVHFFIKKVRHFHRAGRFTIATGCTFLHINIARSFTDPRDKIPSRPFQRFHFSNRVDIDVRVAQCIGHFRPQKAHRAFISRESFIKLCHFPADRRLISDHMHEIAAAGQVQG